MAFGPEQIGVGSAEDNAIVVPGAAPHHARLLLQNGALVFIDLGGGLTAANGAPVPPGQVVPFDFRTMFALNGHPLPLSHPALLLLIMSRGTQPAPPGQILVGREPTRASLVISNAAVSGQHATVMLDRMMVIDHGSTSGTYLGGQRIPTNQTVPIDPNGVIAFGPVPVPVGLLADMLQGRVPGVSLGGGGYGPPAQHGAQQHAPPYGSQVAMSAHQPQPSRHSQPQPPPQQMTGLAPIGAGGGGGGGADGGPRKHRTVIGELSLDVLQSSMITIGRTPDNQIVVPHPQVSARHAVIVKAGNDLFLEDKGSANGTFVRGERIAANQRVPIANGERIFIGPMPVVLNITGSQVGVVVEDSHASWAGKPTYEIEGWDLFLEVPDRDQKGAMKTLLDHVSFKALPGDMIALMGPSGAGKTTLLLTLNGYLPPTSGQVRINGEDLYSIYDALRGSIGYVPQDDIVHPELTVFEAVKYSAKFRLPPDYSEEEIDARVWQTLRDLGLDSLANLEIGKPEKKVLSGGQRKRVNIALELVTDPVILFLDEPTSGLAADDTTALITLLSDLTKATGKTIIMTIHQPAKDEFEKFNVCFIMGYGGIPTYFGPTGESSYRFFGSIVERHDSPYRALDKSGGQRRLDNPRDMFDMLNLRERGTLEQMKQRDPNAVRNTARLEAARGWRAEFFTDKNPVFQRMYSGARAVGTESLHKGTPHTGRVPLMRQFGLLMSRYWKVKLRDRTGSLIMFAQAPIIGLMLWLVFGGQVQAVPFWCLGALQDLASRNKQFGNVNDLLSHMHPTADHTVAMFFVVVSCVWFGTSNSAREIVNERAIYLRERMVNLRLFNYVFSKFVPLAFICVIQCTVLLGIVFAGLGFQGGPLAFGIELISMVAVAINATALGLLLSTVVSSAEAAMALTPIALIPQVVLGGLMVPMTTNPMLRWLMYVMPARWGFEGSIASERLAVSTTPAWLIDLSNPSMNSSPDFISNGKFNCAMAQMQSDTIAGAWGFTEWYQLWLPPTVLMGMSFLMIIVLLILLKRRDPV
jgi:ABC-type multidrug transport system ATPase subunit/pSer/pThr/pTyr-binding forkhead associated (FHA) protein